MSLLVPSLLAGAGATLFALVNLRAAVTANRLPRIEDQPAQTSLAAPSDPVQPAVFPRLSVIVPACNEANTLEPAMRSLLACDYPNLEIVLVDDRSTDGTSAVVDRIAAADPRVLPIHVTLLPDGWLGKLHALDRGTRAATGEFLLYTDADVVFAPDILRRAVLWMAREQLDHLTLLPQMVGNGLLLQAAIASFATGLLVLGRAHAIGRPGSRAYLGVGAFGMVRRSTFERTRGFSHLRLEIADDTGLAMLMVRDAGGRSRLGVGGAALSLRWYDSVPALVRGLEKNLFAIAARYQWWRAIASVALGLFWAWSPLVAIGLGLLGEGAWLGVVGACAIATQGVVAAAYQRAIAQPTFGTLLAPIGANINLWSVIRSTVMTLRRGGVSWRGTFYPLAALRAGRRIDL